jgi:hypothetical protein
MMGVSAGDVRGAATGPHPVARAKGPHALTNGTPVSGHLTGGGMTASSGPHDAQAPGRLDDAVARSSPTRLRMTTTVPGGTSR